MFLDNPTPLNPTLAGYFSKIMIVLVKHSSIKLLEVVDGLGLFERFVYHLESRAIATAFLSILQNDHTSEPFLCAQRACAVSKVAARLTLEAKPEVVMNACYILSSFVIRGRGVNGWQEAFTSLTEEFFGNLLDLLSCSQTVLVKAVAEICSSVLTTEAMNLIPDSQAAEKFGKAPLIHQITSRLPALVALLDADSTQTILTPYGIQEPMLGETKIKLIELLSDMIKLKSPELSSAIAAHDCVGVILRLVLKHQWNSVLHQTFLNFVDRLLIGVDCFELRESLFRINLPEVLLSLVRSPTIQTS